MDRRTFCSNFLFITGFTSLLTNCSSLSSRGKLEKHIDPKLLMSNCKSMGFSEIGITYHLFNYICHVEQGVNLCRGTDGSIFLFDHLGNYSTIPLSIPAHSFIQHPVKKNLIWIIPSFDKKSVLFDLNTFKIVDEIEFPGFYFYGHGLVLKDGTFLATMTHPYDFGKGLIITFDPITKKIEKKLEIDGTHYHEIIYSPKGDTLFAAVRSNNCGGVHEISLPELKVINDFPLNNRYKLNHLTFLKNGKIFFGGAAKPEMKYPFSLVPFGTLDPLKNEFKIFNISPEDMKYFSGEVLNFVFNDDQTHVYAINPEMGSMYVTKLSDMSVEQGFPVPFKAILQIDNAYVATSANPQNSNLFINMDLHSKNLNRIPVSYRPSGFGSHSTNIKI